MLDNKLAGEVPAASTFGAVPKVNQLRTISLGIIAYLLLALLWWSVLLYTKNQDAFQAKAAVLELRLAAAQRIEQQTDLYQQPEYKELEKEYSRQGLMILAEGFVLMISLVAGIYLVGRGYRKEVENARQQRNFLLSITHELKSPLAGIQLALETLRKRSLDEQLRQKLTGSALGETTRLTTLVEDLLLSAKLDASYEPNLEPVDVSLTGKEWIERMRSKYPDIAFFIHLDGNEFSVLADHYGLNSVFSNLLENAVKYLGEGNQIGIEICERGNDLLIEVQDDGLGISTVEKEKVFEKFYRIGNEDTRSTKGTGLGLYIVNEVIRAHHGSVKIRDNSPRGTIFQICLPFGGPT